MFKKYALLSAIILQTVFLQASNPYNNRLLEQEQNEFVDTLINKLQKNPALQRVMQDNDLVKSIREAANSAFTKDGEDFYRAIQEVKQKTNANTHIKIEDRNAEELEATGYSSDGERPRRDAIDDAIEAIKKKKTEVRDRIARAQRQALEKAQMDAFRAEASRR